MKALQHPAELARFVELVRKEGVRSYLEIGCKFGGTFSAVTRAMPPGRTRLRLICPPAARTGRRAGSRLMLVLMN